MTYYEGLPIYKSTMDTIVLLERITQRFPKRHKYTLGARLLDTATDCLLWVARAQRRGGRMQSLDRLCGRVEELKLLIQVGKEVKAFESSSSPYVGSGGTGWAVSFIHGYSSYGVTSYTNRVRCVR